MPQRPTQCFEPSISNVSTNNRRRSSAWAIFWTAGIILTCAGCLTQSSEEVIVYSALDREFSEPILNDLGGELRLAIRPKFDQESNKTVGLANEIIQKKNRPPADIFWNNEILHTFRLQNEGLLEVYRSPEGERFPKPYRSAEGHWHGFAARARVLLVNTDLIPEAKDYPNSIYDLANPKWKGKCGIAKPVFGTTATHAAVLLATLGEASGKKLLSDIASNAVVEGGNKQVAIKVASGQLAFGLTDTDDAMIEIEQGNRVTIVFPDQGPDQMGTLVIPNTLALIKGGPNPERAKKVIDRLLKSDIEKRLAAGASAQLPLATDLTDIWRVRSNSSLKESDEPLKQMRVDFSDAAKAWDQFKTFLAEL